MGKFVLIEKRSKKEQRKLALAQRNSWNGVNPASRLHGNAKKKKLQRAYDKEYRKGYEEW